MYYGLPTVGRDWWEDDQRAPKAGWRSDPLWGRGALLPPLWSELLSFMPEARSSDADNYQAYARQFWAEPVLSAMVVFT